MFDAAFIRNAAANKIIHFPLALQTFFNSNQLGSTQALENWIVHIAHNTAPTTPLTTNNPYFGLRTHVYKHDKILNDCTYYTISTVL